MRIYGKTNKIADDYYELPYKEYRPDGTLKATGTEDFSGARLRTLEVRGIYTWDGQRRNAGGKRWFDYHGHVRVNAGDLKELKAYAAAKYAADLVQIR